ncbi:MAG TPA: hypothetical protein VEV17_01330 [Bryobacteraceae bacterium]|nr:hypothetical protein [Bryobacteraceae bacterium]
MTVTEPRVAGPELERPRIPRIRKLAPYFLAAALLSIPCVWQRHIQANDLSSHLYNAWLANQAAAGQLQGLYVVPQRSNVLFDLMLSWLLKSGSVALTERVAVLTAVQIFFWCCFALVSVVAGRPAWRVALFLVFLTYGAVFRLGFFNFYMSAGICCGAIALVWQNRPRARWLAIPVLLIAAVAHFLPCLWATAVIVYVLAARRLTPVQLRWLAGVALAGIVSLTVLLATSVRTVWEFGLPVPSSFGVDQVMNFSSKDVFVAAGLLGCWIMLLARRFKMQPRPIEDVAFQLWVLTGTTCLLAPKVIWLPFYAGGLTFILARLSLLSGILFCAAIARVPVKRLEKAVHFSVLGLFLLFSYADERALNSMEQKVAQAVAGLPPGSRVVATLKDSRLLIQALQHIVDRPCIGRCFDFVNYEPATTQFRLRARPDNSYVLANYADLSDLQEERFVFRRTDVDVYRLSPCGGATRDVCVTRLKPGERLFREDIQALASAAWIW